MSTLKERNLKFETKQLHVGQESADPVTDSRAVHVVSVNTVPTAHPTVWITD